MKKTIENNRLSHAYLIETNGVDYADELIISLVKEILSYNSDLDVNLLIDQGSYPDFKIIESDNKNIKKEEIKKLESAFSVKHLYGKYLIYLIKDAEKLNDSSANALLKFLEEPDGQVVAILLTEQIQSILPTIRSRCQQIKFAKAPREALIEDLINQEVSASMAATLSMVTNDIDTALELATDEQFLLARKTVLKLVEIVHQNVHEALLFVHDEWLPLFKEKEEMEQALDLLLFAYRDMVAIKANQNSTCTYPDMYQRFNDIGLTLTYDKLSRQMQSILQARANLNRNMNRTLLMEQLMLNLQEGYTFV